MTEQTHYFDDNIEELRIIPTHFLEVWSPTFWTPDYTVCLPIECLESQLEETKLYPSLKTIAVWLIRRKQPGQHSQLYLTYLQSQGK